MVCNRCIKVVKEELEKIDLIVESISLGEVDVTSNLDIIPFAQIKRLLEREGFELLEDKKTKIIEKIKRIILENIHYKFETLDPTVNFSDLIASELKLDYPYLSKIFSSNQGITIEQFAILQKIERAKELLKYGELSLSEIAYQLGYSSVQHLSNQFKKVTGLTASQFKTQATDLRKPLDAI
ncbi:MAG: AraC family transcriptional regulator [Bacteroidetes bacterium]|nr:AraC family transcriptional regulator [Bacteroidota bacterium]